MLTLPKRNTDLCHYLYLNTVTTASLPLSYVVPIAKFKKEIIDVISQKTSQFTRQQNFVLHRKNNSILSPLSVVIKRPILLLYLSAVKWML